jgi:molybdenum cofactor guanylyltransferase
MSAESLPAEGFVLAGGRSTRMGQNKAQLELGGRSLLERALQKLRALPLEAGPRIAGGSAALLTHAAVISDLHPGFGPLSGIEAALAASSQPLNLFLPVDTPLLPAQFLIWMLRRAQITGAVATVPRFNSLPQPLCAVYHRRLLDPITVALLAGDYKVMSVIRAAAGPLRQAIDLFDVELVASTDSSFLNFSPLPLYRWFHNCNTPDDLARIGNALVLTQ